MLRKLPARLRWELPATMKDFTEITLCSEALDHSKVGLGLAVPLRDLPPATQGSLQRAPHGATHARSPADRVLQPCL